MRVILVKRGLLILVLLSGLQGLRYQVQRYYDRQFNIHDMIHLGDGDAVADILARDPEQLHLGLKRAERFHSYKSEVHGVYPYKGQDKFSCGPGAKFRTALDLSNCEMDKDLTEKGNRNRGWWTRRVIINITPLVGISPLAHAVEQGQDGIAIMLLKAGAVLPVKDGTNLLHAAAQKDMLELVRFLINHGFSINHQDAMGRTALTFAVANYAVQTRSWLRAAGGIDTSWPETEIELRLPEVEIEDLSELAEPTEIEIW